MNIYRNIFFKLLNHIKMGCIEVIEGDNTYTFGDPTEPHVQIRIQNPKVYKMVVYQGILGASTAYIYQYWTTKELSSVLNIIIRNQAVFRKLDTVFSKVFYWIEGIINFFKPNNIKRAKQQIIAHYDLGNQFFELFLDHTMMYSCAIYNNSNQSLEDASVNKLRITCEKLKLHENDHLLEIGSGWGSLAIFAAKNYGCQVTTTTISEAQYEYVVSRVCSEQLEDKITVIKNDYRQLAGEYDKIVSIEMIEAVGFQNFANYFSQLNNLLKKDGICLIQAITIQDVEYERAKLEVDFIKKYIFPGGCLPSLSIIRKYINTHTSLKEIHMEPIGKHYVQTLEEWSKRFQRNYQKIKKLGFSEEFINQWKFYFAYCQAGFHSKHIDNYQGLWIKK